MSIPFFLYRRLSRWITCEFRLFQESIIGLHNKYEVASFSDVFCHPFYWQIFQYLPASPKLVVDCGAHCGHFSVLSNICINSKFDCLDAEYLLVEPNPHLIPILENTTKEAGLAPRTQIHHGLLGAKSGTDTLWVDPKNYLATGLSQSDRAKPYEVGYLDLDALVGNRPVDLMKIDIEGGEFDFVDANLDVLSRTNLIFMELHAATEKKRNNLIKQLASVGLSIAEDPVRCHGQELVIFSR